MNKTTLLVKLNNEPIDLFDYWEHGAGFDFMGKRFYLEMCAPIYYSFAGHEFHYAITYTLQPVYIEINPYNDTVDLYIEWNVKEVTTE